MIEKYLEDMRVLKRFGAASGKLAGKGLEGGRCGIGQGF